ncbi:TonB-dependent receptor [Granulicella arctica]|uniref:TonB-dependent receptor n=1 Tax=Granulicella arctica TaxID=940613 RepID=UPI0021DF8F53|nr:TonB-dependent receptor [Granulicella arctica]
MHEFCRSILALCALLPICLPAIAQTLNAVALAGQIVDAGGAAIVGARIEVRQLDGAADIHLLSNQEGRYSIISLPVGRYEIHVDHAGFQDLKRQVQIQVNNAALILPLAVSSLTESVTVNGQSSLITETPTGQTQTSVSREDFRDTLAANIGEVLALTPGVTVAAGNGPRDVAISVRGSNERQTYGIRNTQVFEDGFPVTQPDGLARTDLTDPHAYSSIDVVQGPSSALYGNYATGGAINFHTRTGGEIQGLEVGADFGSFGYFNDYITYGVGGDRYQVSGFLSNVRAAQATANNSFNTITANLLASFAATPKDRFTIKFIDNDLDTNLSIRLSKIQYQLNPLQKGCEVYTTTAAATGCASVSLFNNGYNGTKVSLTAAQAGLGRHDRRTIFGARYEHDLTDNTTWRTQFVFDNRDANQPTSSTTYRGTLPSFNVVSDVLRRGNLWSRHGTTFAGGFFNYENIKSLSANLVPGGNAALGGQTQTVYGKHLNAGAHVRQEIALAERWMLVAGLGAEYTGLNALASNFTYPVAAAPIISSVSADRTFFNVAPEVSVQYRPNDHWRLHGRLGTGYGTPQATQLFTNAQGAFGNNTTLKTQRNTGVDVGADLSLGATLQASVTGFYEWFQNEMVTQSSGVNLQSYTFNAPASTHRGVEVGLDWHPLPVALSGARLRVSYMYDNQIYTNYSEAITSGTLTGTFSRSGNMIPGVVPNFLNARVVYDQPTGKLRGFGGFIEADWRDNYQLDNANLLTASGFTLLNISMHYDPPTGHGALSRLRFYFDIQNLANKTYVASAGNITNSLNATTGLQNGASVLATSTGSIYTGTPRASYGGVRVRF